MNNDWIAKLSEYVATGEGIAWLVGLVLFSVAVPFLIWLGRIVWKKLDERRRLRKFGVEPDDLPLGFSSIEREPTGSLRDYLGSEKQPYYGWSHYRKSVPFSETGSFSDERELLDALLQDDAKPLLLTGEGGCGKTRLALELCRAARNRSGEKWQPLAINRTIREKNLNDLIDRLRPTNRRFILMLDYVETLEPDMSFDRIHELVTSCPKHLRLVATCRRTYYDNIQTRPSRFLNGHCLVLNLNESPATDYGQWLAGWREAACREIHGTEEPVAIPALAVILRYLMEKKINPGAWRQDKEDEWVYGILMHSVKTHVRDLSPSSEELARLLAIFPVPHTAWRSIAAKEFRSGKILDAWKRDGWISSVSGRKAGADRDGYELGHDLLCDLPLLYHLRQSPNLLKDRLDTLWQYAREYEAERPFFITLKRNLPTLALHFNIVQLLDPTRNSERTESIHPDEPERAAKVQSMVVTSLSLSYGKIQDRAFDAIYGLSHDELAKWETWLEDERRELTKKAKESPDDASWFIVRNLPANPMLWFYMCNGGFFIEDIPLVQAKLMQWSAMPNLSKFIALLLRQQKIANAAVVRYWAKALIYFALPVYPGLKSGAIV